MRISKSDVENPLHQIMCDFHISQVKTPTGQYFQVTEANN